MISPREQLARLYEIAAGQGQTEAARLIADTLILLLRNLA